MEKSTLVTVIISNSCNASAVTSAKGQHWYLLKVTCRMTDAIIGNFKHSTNIMGSDT